MSIKKEEIMKLATLSKISFNNDDELEKFSNQLNRIMNYIDKLCSLDTSSVEPLYNCAKNSEIFREDKVKAFPQEQSLKNVPKKENNFIVVPKIIG